MSLVEVLVSSMLLASSSSAALAVWSQAGVAVQRSSQLEERANQLERQRLATHRWLASLDDGLALLDPAADCAFAAGAVAAAADQALPLPDGAERRWVAAAEGAGLWLELEHGPARRRQLFSAAAYGLCQP